jgi:hypothetical protein
MTTDTDCIVRVPPVRPVAPAPRPRFGIAKTIALGADGPYAG